MSLKLNHFLALINFIINLIIIFIITIFLTSCTPYQPPDLNSFAQCLTEKGAVMYGASWCPHCTEQKELFGSAFEKINYVECTVEKQQCSEEGIQYLPMWKFSDGSSVVGKQTFSQLAEKTRCKN